MKRKVKIIQKSKSSSIVEKVFYHSFLSRVDLRPIDALITSLAVVREQIQALGASGRVLLPSRQSSILRPEFWGNFPANWGSSPQNWGSSPKNWGIAPESWGTFPKLRKYICQNKKSSCNFKYNILN